jgi:hypothetical protein
MGRSASFPSRLPERQSGFLMEQRQVGEDSLAAGEDSPPERVALLVCPLENTLHRQECRCHTIARSRFPLLSSVLLTIRSVPSRGNFFQEGGLTRIVRNAVKNLCTFQQMSSRPTTRVPRSGKPRGSGEIPTMFPPRCGFRGFYPGIVPGKRARNGKPLSPHRELGERLVSVWHKDALSGSLH